MEIFKALYLFLQNLNNNEVKVANIFVDNVSLETPKMCCNAMLDTNIEPNIIGLCKHASLNTLSSESYYGRSSNTNMSYDLVILCRSIKLLPGAKNMNVLANYLPRDTGFYNKSF